MSQPADTKPAETPVAPGPPTAAAALPPKSSALGGLLKFIVPAILAAGASYGGARGAAAHPPAAAAPHKAEAVPPGPTVALEPFLVQVSDTKGKGHAMKLTVAVEFAPAEKEDALKPFAARIRDAILSYVRALSFEDAADGAHVEKLRAEMLERCHGAGATGAVRVLITDFVIQ
jgi:flagellar protein FliL